MTEPAATGACRHGVSSPLVEATLLLNPRPFPNGLPGLQSGAENRPKTKKARLIAGLSI
jgi:hypothetical protein